MKIVVLILVPLVFSIAFFSSFMLENNIDEKCNKRCDLFDSIVNYRIDIIEPGNEIVYNDTLRVQNQESFDSLAVNIKQLIQGGSLNILVVIDSGRYYFKNKHISISDICQPINLKIIGNGAALYGKGLLGIKEQNPRFAYCDSANSINGWSDVVSSTASISKVGELNSIYQIGRNKTIDVSVGDYIQISQWYTSSIYKVVKVTDDYIVFSTSDFKFEGNSIKDINADYTYGKVLARYRIFPLIKQRDTLYECRAINFLSIKNTSVNTVILENISFNGSAYSTREGVINFSSTNAKLINVVDCQFTNCKNPCISLQDTKNANVNYCNFYGNYNHCVISDDQCMGICVLRNSFSDNGKGWMNSFNVRLSGENFCIAHNTFSNFNYGAIGIGNWWGTTKNGLIAGIVEYNEIFYTDNFFNAYKSNTLMDSGAIYVMTVNDDVHIRYNRIYNIIGIKANRGIFCDDGTCNTKIYGNVVTGIDNSYCIDLRYVPTIESKENYTFGKVNIGNALIYNIIDGNCRFEGRKGSNSSIKGMNYILHKNEGLIAEIAMKNIQVPEKDFILQVKNIAGGIIELSDSSMGLFKKQPIFKCDGRWFR